MNTVHIARLPTVVAELVRSICCPVLQAYWLYRPTEVPSTAWRGFRHLKGHTAGCAAYRLPGRKQLAAEDISERQVT